MVTENRREFGHSTKVRDVNSGRGNRTLSFLLLRAQGQKLQGSSTSQRNRRIFSVTAVHVGSEGRGHVLSLAGCCWPLIEWIQCLMLESQKALCKTPFFNASIGSVMFCGEESDSSSENKNELLKEPSPVCLKPKWTEGHWAAKPRGHGPQKQCDLFMARTTEDLQEKGSCLSALPWGLLAGLTECSLNNDSSFKEKIASIFQRLNGGAGT